MIRDQCHACCQCSYCAQEPQNTSTNAGASMRAAMQCLSRPGMSKDELYMKGLRQSLREKAFADSSKNVGRFIPDEQLLSSTKRKEEKELALAAELVPVRRRDRLQELLLLEHKARLDEEARLRAERRALGLPDEEGRSVTPVLASTRPSSKTGTTTPPARLSSGAATPVSQCSADHDLHTMLRGIRDIVDEDATAAASAPLNQQQIFKLRQLVHNQEKARAMVDDCESRPHLCRHCMDVNVQARHLCPLQQESVAFSLTGKVINPEEGIKYGTESARGFDGTYSAASVNHAMLSSKKSRQGVSYGSRPAASRVALSLVAPVNAGSPANTQSARFRASFNNNFGGGEAVEAGLQFPGSTYNVYDRPESRDGAAAAKVDTKADSAASIDTVSSNASSKNAANSQKAAGGGAAVAADSTYASSSAMWKTTNQERELDMRRFLEFQQKLKTNSKRVYCGSASRSTKAAST